MGVREAPLRATKYGLGPDGDGWFVVNARETRARGGREGIAYVVAPAALKYGAGVEEQPTKFAEAYARFARPARSPYREGCLPTF
jgi:hypothetical protein